MIFSVKVGPIYADRANGKVTLRDWDTWEAEDKTEWLAMVMAMIPPPEPPPVIPTVTLDDVLR